MRDIKELLEQKKPAEQMTDAEVLAQMQEEDRRLIHEFSDEPMHTERRMRIRTRRWI